MQGFYTRYVPGWDTHGLPIETALVKKKKINRNLIDKVEFRNMCRDYAKIQVDTQKEQFKRLGILGEWDNPYVTLDAKYEASQIRVFAEMVEKNGILFIGPKSNSIRMMGDKLAAKEAVKNYNIPMVPGVDRAVTDPKEAIEVAHQIGFPILIKAAAGGGGKGMRVVEKESDVEEQMQRAISEAT